MIIIMTMIIVIIIIIILCILPPLSSSVFQVESRRVQVQSPLQFDVYHEYDVCDHDDDDDYHDHAGIYDDYHYHDLHGIVGDYHKFSTLFI